MINIAASHSCRYPQCHRFSATLSGFHSLQQLHITKMEDLNKHVHSGDLLAACRAVNPSVQAVISFETRRATASVQGFTSLMLRVTASVRLEDCSTSEIKLIFKMQSEIEAQRKLLDDCGLFEKEVMYFRDVVPILKQRCPQLPPVDCLVAHGSTLIMEDLCASGFSNIVEGFTDLAREDAVTLAHVRLVMRRLAQLHAASLHTDWLTRMPAVKYDPMFEGAASSVFRDNMAKHSAIAASIALRELKIAGDRSEKYADWLLGSGVYDAMARLAQPVPGAINVLCHGDCHANNMMFRHVDGTPVDVKFVDFQIFRYAPPTRDLCYFLYTSVNRKFRLQHEKEVLKTYVEAFNAAADTTPDPIPCLDAFIAEYNSARLFGLGMGMALRPLLHVEKIMPEPGQQLTEEKYNALLFDDYTKDTLHLLTTNPKYKEELTDILEDLTVHLDTYGLL